MLLSYLNTEDDANKHIQQKKALKNTRRVFFSYMHANGCGVQARDTPHTAAREHYYLPFPSLAETDRAGEDNLGLLAEGGPESSTLSAIVFLRFSVNAYIPRRIALPVQSRADVRMKSPRSRAPDVFPFPFHGTIRACNAMLQCSVHL